MHTCDSCGSEYNSVSAMLQCVQDCERETANTRDWYARYNPHRKD